MAGTVPTSKRLPLTVVGGFLGAGKTTLAEPLCCAPGAGPAHGGAGERLRSASTSMPDLIGASARARRSRLANGCVCCPDRPAAWADALVARARALEHAARNAVVIEASGVSDPWRMAQDIGMAAPELSLEGVIVLVDASAAARQSRDPLLADTLARQLKSADLVVVNKIDLASETALAEARAWVDATAPGTPCIQTAQSTVPLSLLSGLALPATGARGRLSACRCPSAISMTTKATRPTTAPCSRPGARSPRRCIPAAALRAWLREVPPGVLRLKGVLRTGHGAGGDDWSEVQFAGRHGSLRKAAPPDDARAAVVAIGLRGAGFRRRH